MKLLTKIDDLIRGVNEAADFARKSFAERQYKLMKDHHDCDIWHKSEKELVVREDVVCQDIIIAAIRDIDPEAVIFSEELNNIGNLKEDHSCLKYVLDPLDGTHNFCFGLPFWGISLAILNEKNEPVWGLIAIPELSILLKGEQGNDTMIRKNGLWEKVSTTPRPLKDSLICYDNQFYKLGERSFKVYQVLTKNCFTTRITGSAATDIALIATGKINARLWNNTVPYDIAAGIPIILGAGGCLSDFKAKEANVFFNQIMMCSDKQLRDDMVNLFERSDIP